jgi:2-polyprenyl-3-methyl-5-hydroxy-6-metoxy-1,4-benzoquinol methylase
MANPTPLEAAYNRYFAELEHEDAGDAPWHGLVKRYLVPARDLADKRVLEIGCGRGGFSCWLFSRAERPAELVAADFSQTALEMARAEALKRGLDGIHWQYGDIQNIDYPDSSFDTVISCETIEHVPDPVKAVAELARVLKPGGHLFLTTPNYLNLLGLYRGYLRLRGRRFTEGDQPINNFMLFPSTLRWVRRTGLVIQAFDGIQHWLPLPRRPGGINVSFLNRGRFLTRWFALRSFIVARKPGGPGPG